MSTLGSVTFPTGVSFSKNHLQRIYSRNEKPNMPYKVRFVRFLMTSFFSSLIVSPEVKCLFATYEQQQEKNYSSNFLFSSRQQQFSAPLDDAAFLFRSTR